MSPWEVSQLVLWIVVGLNLVLTFALIRRVSAVPSGPPSGLVAGDPAPAFAAAATDGSTVTRSDLGQQPLVLGFFSPSCDACHDQLPEFVRFSATASAASVQTVAVIDGEPDQLDEHYSTALAGRPTLLAPRDENPLLEQYRVMAYPTYTAIGPESVVEGSFHAVSELDAWLRKRR